MSALFAVLILALLMGIGVPIAWSFVGVLAYLTFLYDVNLNTLMLQGFRSMNSVVLVALPLFILTGHLMQTGYPWLTRVPRRGHVGFEKSFIQIFKRPEFRGSYEFRSVRLEDGRYFNYYRRKSR